MGPRKCMGVIVFLWLSLDMLRCNGCWEEEKIALLQLKQFFNGSMDPLNWNEGGDHSSSDCCKWIMVNCNSTTGHVIEISLYNKRNSPNLLYLNTSYFLPFKELRILNLSFNNIGGCQEEEGFERLSRLSNLEFLDLSGNEFNNSLISSLGSLTSLKVLDLYGNLLSGTIDTQELNTLSNLKELHMGFNKIEGFASSKDAEPLLRLFDLEILTLEDNLFNNTVLSSLLELSCLKYLNLYGNQLSGSVHVKELEALTNLEALNMGGNHIEEFVGPKDKKTLNKLRILSLEFLGPPKSLILQSLEAFSSLRILNFGGNILNRTINVPELANLSTMEELLLDSSILQKDFLQSIGSLTFLKVLSLRSCGLKGTLPNQGWCELKNLQELNLSENELKGTLPPCLANLSSLQKLDLSSNRFIGDIASTSIGRLVSIKHILLTDNHFQIPISFGLFANCSNLKVFYGDGNELTAYPTFQSWTPKFQLQELSLSDCTLHQSIAKLPNFLYYQYDLRYILLYNNNFGGALLPGLLENNTRMEIVDLSNNSFTGIFQFPLHLKNLFHLDISHNRLQGQIPSNLSVVLPHLKVLFANKNAFQGNIPPSFGEMKSLQELDLSNNYLSSRIPEQLFEQQSSLEKLVLSNNRLSGPMFPTNFSSTKFLFIKLDGNNLVGEIPDLSSSTYLAWLDISNNLVSGKLPKSMANWSNLQHIDLAKNNLEGSISSELCQLYKLQHLVLSENNFSGPIPSCLNRLRSLERVHLNKNKLTGLMPHAFMNSSNLVILDLGNNNFTGTIPNWIGTLQYLSVLLLQGNNFLSEIPTTLCQLNELTILDLSSNSLSGHLPPCLGNLTLTTMKELSSIFIHGLWFFEEFYYYMQEVVQFTSKKNSLLYKGKPLDNMNGIDLSCNHFTGEIPIDFGNLSNVKGLNMSHNNLTGPIPTSFSNLIQLESLDLSHNNLNGQIPYQLTYLNSLEVFSVAYNNLSGPLLDRKAQFGTFDETSYEGNPFLCGPPLNNSCDKISPASPTHGSFYRDSKNSGFMDIYDFYVSFAASYVVVLLAIAIVLWINPYWRQQWFYTIEVISMRCCYFFVDMFTSWPTS